MKREIAGYEVDGGVCCLACVMPENRQPRAAVYALEKPIPIPIESYGGDMQELIARCGAGLLNTDPLYYAETSDGVLIDRCDMCGDILMTEADLILKVLNEDGAA